MKKINEIDKKKSKKVRISKDPGKTVYIGNLSYQKSEIQIKRMFFKFGNVKSVKLITDLKSGQSQGIAFVKMSRSTEALNAINALNGQEIDGRVAKVSVALERNQSNAFIPNPKNKAMDMDIDADIDTRVTKKTKKAKKVSSKNSNNNKKQGLSVLFDYLKG
ncbi:MAG: hypothetical protein ISR65_06125 [Bacteriovoracaceae bacterium]|nr:hypothetical protein [Bacteriovoracaceae bacterium]